MTSLYNISKEYQLTLDLVMQCDEVGEQQLAELNRLEGAIEDKAIGIAYYIQNLKEESHSVKCAAKAMLTRAKYLDAKQEYLSKYLLLNLQSSGVSEIRKSPHFVIKVRTNPVKVVIDDVTALPDEFVVIRETRSEDKIGIAKALKDGFNVPGAYLVADQRLEIK